jgi:hypothetical protein
MKTFSIIVSYIATTMKHGFLQVVYQGGIQSNQSLLKKNNGKIVPIGGKLTKTK